MNIFSVGEKVALYQILFGRRVFGRRVGTVIRINSPGSLTVRVEGEDTYVVHPKQCRKLRPKKLRRRIWVSFYGDNCAMPNTVRVFTMDSAKVTDEMVEFVEVRRSK